MPIGATCWTLICIALFTASLITGFKAIKHKNRAAYITAIRFFIAFALCGSYTLMKTGVKLFGISANTFTQDEGEEIYTRMLGKPASCVTILAAEGAYIPIADDDESIHFKTCPAEVRRTLGNNTYYVTTVAKSDFRSDIDGDSVFYAKGDSILELYRSTGTVSGVQIYLAMDSTEMFYREAW